MPAVLLILVFLLLSSGGVVLFRQYKRRIAGLEHDLATATTQITALTQNFTSVQKQSEYETYAGTILSRMDRAVILIDQNRTVRLINEHAKRFLDLAVEPNMPFKDILNIQTAKVRDPFALLEAAFMGHAQLIPDNTVLVSPRGTFPISGSLIPLATGTKVTSVVFLFEDNSKQAARVKEEQAFFSTAAHQLRTPLTVIRMTVSLLLEKFGSLPKEKIIEHLRRTDETTEKLVTLVNEFLNISRIDQGRLEVKTEKFDMVTLTDEVIGSLSLLAKERNLYVHHEITVSDRMVVGDRSKASEVLTNLIGNSIKYTVQGGVTITHETTGTMFSTSIADTGSGIPRDSQRLLFTRFGQIGDMRSLDPATRTGLGLYISKKLAELMRGDVVLEKSEPGTGSVFAFVLPLR